MNAISEMPIPVNASIGKAVGRVTRKVNRPTSIDQLSKLFRSSVTSPSNVTSLPYEDETWVFQQNLYALCKVNRRREAIAEALDFFDERLIARQFDDCGRVLRQLDVTKLQPSVMVSVLGITIHAKTLKGRAIFFERALQEIARQKGDKYAKELLEKYR